MNQQPRDLGRKHCVTFKGGLKLKKAEAENERCVGYEFGRTTIENPKKALDGSDHSENGSRALQHTSNCIL